MKIERCSKGINLLVGLCLGTFPTILVQPAQALTFNFNYESTVTQEVKDAMEEAGSIWSSYLKDDVVLNVDVGFGGISQQYLGGARPEMVRVDYGDVITQLSLDQTSEDDATALLHLPIYEKEGDVYVKRLINGIEQGSELTSHEDKSVDNLWITRANAKALGIIASDPNDSTSDAQLRFSDFASWDFSQEKIEKNQFDFTGVALHELGHVLGFLSGVDVLDYHVSQKVFYQAEDYDYVTTLDLFRASKETKGEGMLDWTVDDQEEYFSLDGGKKEIAVFANGSSALSRKKSTDKIKGLSDKDWNKKTDGFQASHWEEKQKSVMRPILSMGKENYISEIDLRLLDSIGWDLETGSQVNYQSSEMDYSIGEGAFDSALGWGQSSSRSTSWSFWQEGTFLASTAADTQTTPEADSAIAIVALGLVGCKLYRKRLGSSS